MIGGIVGRPKPGNPASDPTDVRPVVESPVCFRSNIVELHILGFCDD